MVASAMRWSAEAPPMLPVLIRGPRGSLRVQALVDTGAGSFFLHPRVIATLGLRPIGPSMIHSAVGDVPTTSYEGSMEALGQRFDGVEVVALGPRCTAIALCGRSLLRFFRLTFDGPRGGWTIG